MKLSKTSYELNSLINTLPNFIPKQINKKFERSLLLTGATGFLGIHLLLQLVRSLQYKKIYIIVRNKEKLKQQIAYYQIDSFSFENIEIIENDLLNMKENDFPAVETVIHSAAEIHCLKNLNQLCDNNVLTTQKICNIYQNDANIYFISTLSVFVSSNLTGNHYPTSLPISNSYILYGGYAQSKYISEKIVEACNGNIIRLGLLTGSTYLGQFPVNDFFSQIVTTLNKIKIYPENFEEAYVDLTPVDLCAEKIVQHIISGKDNILHIANKKSISLTEILNELNLKKVHTIEFQKQIKELPTLPKTLLEFAFFKSTMLKDCFRLFNIDLFQSTNHSYNIENNFNISNTKLIKKYLQNITGDSYEEI